MEHQLKTTVFVNWWIVPLYDLYNFQSLAMLLNSFQFSFVSWYKPGVKMSDLTSHRKGPESYLGFQVGWFWQVLMDLLDKVAERQVWGQLRRGVSQSCINESSPPFFRNVPPVTTLRMDRCI